MEPTQIKAIIDDALRDPRNFPILAYVLVFVLAGLGAFAASYLRRKGENVATKEDVAELTDLVERVRTQYAERIENLAHQNRQALEQGGREHQLRLAALDRRLDAHQQAFTLWRKLFFSIYTPEITNTVRECQTWWDSNCLYLDPLAREAFVRAFRAAHLHKDLLDARSPSEDIKANWEKITSAGDAIVRGAALPPIKDLEREGILNKDDKAA
jgi:hypothetical protein